MMKINIKALKESATVAKDIFLTKAKHASPTILIALGVTCAIGAVVTACISTTKIDEELKDEIAERDILVKEHQESNEEDSDYGKKLAKVYFKMGLKASKVYAPTILLLGASIGCTCGSHAIMQKRAASYLAAAAATHEAFTNYRNSVIKELGEEADLKFRNGVSEIQRTTDDGNGNVTTEAIAAPTRKDSIDILFDTGNIPSWYCTSSAAEYLEQKRDELNAKMMRRYKFVKPPYSAPIILQKGYLYWVEIAEALGHNITDKERKENACMACIYTGQPEQLLQFSCLDRHSNDPQIINFLHGFEDSVIVTPNVVPFM